MQRAQYVEFTRQQAERQAVRDGTAEWLENARAARREETGSAAPSSLLEEFSRMGIVSTNGRRGDRFREQE